MIFLILSILCSTAIALLFKVYSLRGINIFQTIISNYWTAVVCGMSLQGALISIDIFDKEWTWVALTLGALFISGFYAMGMTVKYFGVSMGMLTSKMSILISVTAAFLMFSDSLSAHKFIGIGLVIVSIWMVSQRDEVKSASISFLLFPLYLWVASGVIETLLKLAESGLLPSSELNLFNTTIFGTAGMIGTLVFFILLILKRVSFHPKSWIYGILLGIINYFSIYYAVRALEQPEFEASVFYPINNVAIICLSAFLAWLLLSEKLSKINVGGIAVAIIAILIISFS